MSSFPQPGTALSPVTPPGSPSITPGSVNVLYPGAASLAGVLNPNGFGAFIGGVVPNQQPPLVAGISAVQAPPGQAGLPPVRPAMVPVPNVSPPTQVVGVVSSPGFPLNPNIVPAPPPTRIVPPAALDFAAAADPGLNQQAIANARPGVNPQAQALFQQLQQLPQQQLTDPLAPRPGPPRLPSVPNVTGPVGVGMLAANAPGVYAELLGQLVLGLEPGEGTALAFPGTDNPNYRPGTPINPLTGTGITLPGGRPAGPIQPNQGPSPFAIPPQLLLLMPQQAQGPSPGPYPQFFLASLISNANAYLQQLLLQLQQQFLPAPGNPRQDLPDLGGDACLTVVFACGPQDFNLTLNIPNDGNDHWFKFTASATTAAQGFIGTAAPAGKVVLYGEAAIDCGALPAPAWTNGTTFLFDSITDQLIAQGHSYYLKCTGTSAPTPPYGVQLRFPA